MLVRWLPAFWFCMAQGALNSAPQFLPGGDMNRFSLPEDTQVGAPVYRLQGIDPEGSQVHYSISGQHFEVDRKSGIVTLVKSLDRETEEILEVIISITDESVGGAEPNTVSLRREIPVLDVNDNSPEFLGRPYSVVLVENTKPGSIVFSNITILDSDAAHNAEITLSCVTGGCDTFSVNAEKIGDGHYNGIITLRKPLDFEMTSSYSLTLKASDLSMKKTLSAMANIAINIKDIQDQPPVFVNAPYSATLQENLSPGYQVLQIKAKDGDLGEPRPIFLSLEGDNLGYFKISRNTLITTHEPIDRENPYILQNGGVYSFYVVATELINNELPGDFSKERVTIVVTDVDDQIPQFNKPVFSIQMPEDIGLGTPLPGLDMVVADNDLGENSHYTLQLKANDKRALEWFEVEPLEAYGRTPVVVRLKDNTGLDYDSGLRNVQFTISAFVKTKQGENLEVSSSSVNVNIVDANDNAPIFAQSSYSYTIPENLIPGSSIANISATDIDSGVFGTITYSLRGFGTNKFNTDPINGNLYLTSKLDYEKQKSYSLSLEAKDGGGKISTVSLLISLTDVNDNAPTWEMSQYQRTVREGALSFQPQFFVRALDPDKDGESKLKYKLITTNSEVLLIDENTGEIQINEPVSSSHTSRGQYELMIRAFDDGNPPLHADVPVFVRVGVPGNQRPVFRGVPYNVTIKETASKGDIVVKVRATDPDGPDSLVTYRISNGADNFQINQTSGIITVASAAILDPDVTKTARYTVTVLALDSGSPVRETAQTTVTVNILDVNNKAPYFLPDANYVRHISEKIEIGKTVVTVKAIDSDQNANITYKIIDARAMHKTGVPVQKGGVYDFTKSFSIEEKTGEIKISSHLNHQEAAVIILTVEAKDINAIINPESQIAKVEVNLYVQAYNERNPKFTVGGWNPIESTINVNVQEEKPVGNTIFTLKALDPVENVPIKKFNLIPPIPSTITMDGRGNVIILQRIDYESMIEKVISFRVEAISSDGIRSSIAQVYLNVEDINDHSPEFTKNIYHGTVLESAPKGTDVLTVLAIDGDKSKSTGYGDITYSLSGESASFFTIDPETGNIKVAGNGVIDREKQSILRLTAIVSDTPQGGANQRKNVAQVIIEVLDVNDNKPIFTTEEYSAVVLENVGEDTSVVSITAIDLDAGKGGLIEYEIVHQSEAAGLFKINKNSGEIKTKKPLTGKGRNEPYIITARALDQGEPSLFSDVPIRIFIGDVVMNDGVPSFLHPTIDEMAYISENSSIGSPVFRVIATDPDNPNSLEGQVRFSFLQDDADSLAFNIDSITGLITTKEHLDREKKSNYTLFLVAKDSGIVPQYTTRLLKVTVTDIDDNKPFFKRAIDDVPIEFSVKEEVTTGNQVGILKAIDEDIGENAKISYLITYGNEDGLFNLTQKNDSAIINVVGRLDRETASEHLLTIKCFKTNAKPQSLRKNYNRMDLSEIEVKIKIIDIDDNAPIFIKNNITVGIKFNVAVDTLIQTVIATDEDFDAKPIIYQIENIEFSPSSRRDPPKNTTDPPFRIDKNTGEIKTAIDMAEYYDGHFTLTISAKNSENGSSLCGIKIYIVRDRGLMKFVFSQPPGEVRMNLANFKNEMEKALELPVSLNIYDTLFLSKADGSLDFSATSSCFHLVGTHTFEIKEMERLMSPENPNIDEIYRKYNVQGVQRCSPHVAKAEITWVQISVLSIAAFIGLASMVSGCVLCCSYNRWHRIR